jgi:hypothetical protein
MAARRLRERLLISGAAHWRAPRSMLVRFRVEMFAPQKQARTDNSAWGLCPPVNTKFRFSRSQNPSRRKLDLNRAIARPFPSSSGKSQPEASWRSMRTWKLEWNSKPESDLEAEQEPAVVHSEACESAKCHSMVGTSRPWIGFKQLRPCLPACPASCDGPKRCCHRDGSHG